MPGGALSRYKVVEFGQRISAPYCAKLFADFGADVVKVEPPEGDASRGWGPFPGDVPHPEKSGLFFFLNTNKRSLRLDVATDAGRASFLGLVAGADVLIENNPPARMREWGLDWATLSALNPQLVMISITPFGQTGPYSDWQGHDLNAYHLSGASSRYCGRPGQTPLEHGTFSADFFGAVTGAAWGLAAVYGRDRVGAGQHVDVSCAEAIAATFVGGQNIGGYAQDGHFEKRTGVGMPLGAPATILPCKDGHVWMLALEPGQWQGLVEVMGHPEWAQVEIFQDMSTRAQNADFLYAMIGEWAMQHSKLEIMQKCQAAGCPITAVFTVKEAAEHPHLRARGYLRELEHPQLGRVRVLGAPFKLPASPGGPQRPAPGLGQHDRELLASLAAVPPALHAGGHAGSHAGSQAGSQAGRPAAGSPSPLAGIRVANFGWVWAGPVAGQTLAFLGAEVYKVESRARVDMLRSLPPFGGGVRDPDRGLTIHACWAGNGSISLDLKKPESRALALDLVARCDVVIENFGPGVMQQFGLGWEDLRAVKPDLVMLSMPAAGLDGPLKDIRTYGLSLTSTTGLDSLVGYLGGSPIPVENAFSDPLSGIFGAFAVLTALAHRDRSGVGQQIDFSQQEAMMQLVAPAFMDYVLNGRVAGPIENRHPLGVGAPHGVFPCAGDDRWISIAVLDEAGWQGLVRALGAPDWARSPDFATAAARVRHVEALHAKLASWTAGFDDRMLSERLQGFGVAATPVLNVADLLHDPHTRARETFIEVLHPLGFRETIYGAYVKLSRSPVPVRSGPMIGQDNEKVFRDLLGISPERLAALVAQKVVY